MESLNKKQYSSDLRFSQILKKKKMHGKRTTTKILPLLLFNIYLFIIYSILGSVNSFTCTSHLIFTVVLSRQTGFARIYRITERKN